MDLAVSAPGKRFGKKFFLLPWIANITIYLPFIPIVLMHVLCLFYQAIAFTIYDIPKVHLRDFLILDRGKLKKLNWVQRLNCVYCAYANGVLAWLKATGNQTEAYACAIKHSVTKAGQEYQADFYPYEKYQ